MSNEIKNAVIRSTELLLEDHGILTASIILDYGGSCQGFGGYALYPPGGASTYGDPTGLFVYRLLKVVDVDSWDKLAGQPVRVAMTGERLVCDRRIRAIGNIIKDEWFDPKKEFEQMESSRHA